jgi:hypothetical protein
MHEDKSSAAGFWAACKETMRCYNSTQLPEPVTTSDSPHTHTCQVKRVKN